MSIRRSTRGNGRIWRELPELWRSTQTDGSSDFIPSSFQSRKQNAYKNCYNRNYNKQSISCMREKTWSVNCKKSYQSFYFPLYFFRANVISFSERCGWYKSVHLSFSENEGQMSSPITHLMLPPRLFFRQPFNSHRFYFSAVLLIGGRGDAENNILYFFEIEFPC